MNQQDTANTGGGSSNQQATPSNVPGENMPGNLPGNNAPATPSPRGATSTGTNVPAANAQQREEALQREQRGAGGPAQPVNTPTSTTSTGQGQGQLDPEAQGVLNPNPGNLSTNSPDLARCPVCGTVVEKANAADTLPASVNEPQEQTLYFDRAECKAIYEQNPARFGSQR